MILKGVHFVPVWTELENCTDLVGQEGIELEEIVLEYYTREEISESKRKWCGVQFNDWGFYDEKPKKVVCEQIWVCL